jgi:hypothetical protein
MADFTLRPTTGLVPGMTIQFAEGSWPGDIGEGVAVTDEAFDSLEPHLLAACPGWTPMHRYAPYDLSASACPALAQLLRSEGKRLRKTGERLGESALFLDLAGWLEVRCDAGRTLSILGY